MRNPRSVVPTSIMPGYPFLEQTPLSVPHIAEDLAVLSLEGVPYTKEMIDNALTDLVTQASAEDQNTAAFLKRYPKAQVRDLGGVQGRISERIAAVMQEHAA